MSEDREFVDYGLLAAQRKLGLGEEWKWCVLEAVGDTRDILMTLGVPRTLTRGPRKGKTTFRGVALKKCVITAAERQAEEIRFEKETGKCADCYGVGKQTVGWTEKAGNILRPCKKCGATGRAKICEAAP